MYLTIRSDGDIVVPELNLQCLCFIAIKKYQLPMTGLPDRLQQSINNFRLREVIKFSDGYELREDNISCVRVKTRYINKDDDYTSKIFNLIDVSSKTIKEKITSYEYRDDDDFVRCLIILAKITSIFVIVPISNASVWENFENAGYLGRMDSMSYFPDSNVMYISTHKFPKFKFRKEYFL